MKYGVCNCRLNEWMHHASIRFMCNWCPTILYGSMSVLCWLFQTLLSKLTVIIRTFQLDPLDFSIFSILVQFNFYFLDILLCAALRKTMTDSIHQRPQVAGRNPIYLSDQSHQSDPQQKNAIKIIIKAKRGARLHGLDHHNRQNTYWPRYCKCTHALSMSSSSSSSSLSSPSSE